MPLPARNQRTAAKSAIKRASARGRREMNALDSRSLGHLADVYQQAASDLQEEIKNHAGPDGNLRLDVLRSLLGQVNERLGVLERARNDLFGADLLKAGKIGATPFGEAGIGLNTARVANDAVQFVHSFVGEDGLQLSDRIWRIDRHAREAVTSAIESNVIQGHSAHRAAEDFLSRGVTVPPELAAKMGLSAAAGVATAAAAALMKEDDSPYNNALQLFRTELNRAHGEAYRSSAFDHPEVIGTRFLLSPNHPQTDICDMHASVNLYGLGRGVYPKGKSPWPAHPNTLSYEEAVFRDEVSDEDREGKETRSEWLGRQPAGAQADVLGGLRKAQAFRQGVLKESQFGTPWRVLKKRYERLGIEIKDGPGGNTATPAPAPPQPPPPAVPTPSPSGPPEPIDRTPAGETFSPFKSVEAAVRWAGSRGTALLPGTAKIEAINSALLGITRVLDRYGIANTEIAFNRRLGGRQNAVAGTSFDGTVRIIRFAPGRNKSVKEAAKRQADSHALHLRNRDANTERLKRALEEPGLPEGKRKILQSSLEKVRAAERWSISSDPASGDPIAGTASHEAGHTLYYTRRLPDKWIRALNSNEVRPVDMYRVSEYAATNASELWAEVTAAMHTGMSRTIPPNILKAYQEVLDGINPVP